MYSQISHSGTGVTHVLLGVSGALEMGGDVSSAALMEFQGHINRFQVRLLQFL